MSMLKCLREGNSRWGLWISGHPYASVGNPDIHTTFTCETHTHSHIPHQSFWLSRLSSLQSTSFEIALGFVRAMTAKSITPMPLFSSASENNFLIWVQCFNNKFVSYWRTASSTSCLTCGIREPSYGLKNSRPMRRLRRLMPNSVERWVPASSNSWVKWLVCCIKLHKLNMSSRN